MNLALSTPPRGEPLHVSEVKHFLRVTGNAENRLIADLIAKARQWLERYTRRAIVLQSWSIEMDSRESLPPIWLPRPPYRSLTSFVVHNEDDVAVVTSATEYRVVGSDPARIVPGLTDFWEVNLSHRAVKLIWQAGYITPFTVDVATDTITAVGHTYANGDVVRLSNSGDETGTLPFGLAEYTDYYVINVIGDTLQLSATSGGAAIDITSTGSGLHFLGVLDEQLKQALLIKIADMYWFRTSMDVRGKGIASTGVSAEDLADQLRYDYL